MAPTCSDCNSVMKACVLYHRDGFVHYICITCNPSGVFNTLNTFVCLEHTITIVKCSICNRQHQQIDEYIRSFQKCYTCKNYACPHHTILNNVSQALVRQYTCLICHIKTNQMREFMETRFVPIDEHENLKKELEQLQLQLQLQPPSSKARDGGELYQQGIFARKNVRKTNSF